MATIRLVVALVAVLFVLDYAPTPVASATRPAGPWTITALGDSVTAGSACDCAPFVALYAGLTEAGAGVRTTARNLGVPGQTSDELLAALAGGTSASWDVADSDIVVVTIGANDLAGDLAAWQDGDCDVGCFQSDIPAIRANVAATVRRIRELRDGQPTEVLVTDYWNVFRDGDQAASLGAAYRTVSRQVTALADTAICAGARSEAATCVDLAGPFGPDPTALLADDGDHPDAEGHAQIAAALARHGWDELTTR
ncbi:SGNH/GDSL hydrolase family protein [Cryptosporangium phraense]|uniref:SGNH/GDSL hydrolase family protein n=1 Tax=Cryptosporangium phraense TaxID=2593070 RepID=A0A545AXM1_9ACTN|nr:SGNH/GDSL hydrolase family protein [Cryptosporangium phraense]TQS46087.1 SGNH/GDSL hydrolase family protein [Cryptosporangium phraense]